ncbi:MAG: hypothetical protein GYA59_17525 [Chloroflexi bacterium]|nr:hypothetical protein [Chloroflexota bacterium]
MKASRGFVSRYVRLGVVAYFVAMTVVMTWPLVTRMGSFMVGQMGDNIYFVWMIGWMKKALFELHVNPFNVWFLNYPEGWNMAYTEITPVMLALALPFSFVGGPTFAYNMALLLTFVLAGLGMFWWIRQLTGRMDAALIAGTIYAFLPFHFAHFLIGHLNLSGIQWFPFYFMGLFEILQTRRVSLEQASFSWKPVLLTGISLGLIALTSQYYLYMTVIVTAFLGLVYLLFMERGRLRDGLFWKQVLLSVLVAAPLVLLGVAPYFTLLQQGGLPDRNLGILRLYSASPTDFLLPSTDHFLWGRWIGSHFNREMWVEGTLYIGAVSAGLAILAWARRRLMAQGRLLILLLCGSLLALILAMGIDLHWLGEPVEVSLPQFLAQRLNRATTPIPLPGYFLFQFFPLYAKLRALMRFGVFVLVFFSAAAGLGCAWLLGHAKRKWRMWLTLVLLALVFLDFYPGPYREFTPVQARPVDYWLAQQPGEGAVAQFPFIQSEDQEQTYYTLVYNKPFIGGFFNAFPPPQYQRLRPIMENFPDQQSVETLRQLGVEYVLVDRDEYANIASVRQTLEQLGLYFVNELGDEQVYQFTQP